MKHGCINFFYEIVNKISIQVKRNWNLKNSSRLKDDQFILNPDFKKILTFMKEGPGPDCSSHGVNSQEGTQIWFGRHVPLEPWNSYPFLGSF